MMLVNVIIPVMIPLAPACNYTYKQVYHGTLEKVCMALEVAGFTMRQKGDKRCVLVREAGSSSSSSRKLTGHVTIDSLVEAVWPSSKQQQLSLSSSQASKQQASRKQSKNRYSSNSDDITLMKFKALEPL